MTYLHQYLLALVSRHLPTYLPTCPPGCLSLQFTTQLRIYTNSHLPGYPTEVAKYYTTFPKYFPDSVVYRLLFASFSVNSKLVRPFRSFSVPFRSFSVPFRSFSVLFGPFRSFSVLFGPFRCLGRPPYNIAYGCVTDFRMLVILKSLPSVFHFKTRYFIIIIILFKKIILAP